MKKFISCVIVGAIVFIGAMLLLGAEPVQDTFVFFGGLGAFLGAIVALPVPRAIKGTILGAVLGIAFGAVLAFFVPSLRGVLETDAGLWLCIILGAIFGGIVGHNMNEGDGDAEST